MSEIPIVLVGHGDLPEGIRDAAELILGPQPRLHAVGLASGQSPDLLRLRLERLIVPRLHGRGVLILADIFGGTPSRVAATLAHGIANAHVVAGLSLAMLLEVLTNTANDVAELAAIAVSAGVRGTVDINQRIRDAEKAGLA